MADAKLKIGRLGLAGNGWVLGLILSLAGLLGIGLYLYLQPRSGIVNKTYIVRPGTVQETVSVQGTVAQPLTSDLSFSAVGSVARVDVRLGDAVGAGQALAEEDTSLLSLAVSQADGNLADTQAKLHQLTDPPTPEQLASYQANLAAGKTTLDNAQEQYQAGLEKAKQQLAQAQANVQDLQSQLTSDRQSLDSNQNLLANDENLYGFAGTKPILTPQVVAQMAQVANYQAAVQKDQQDLVAARAALQVAQNEVQSPVDLQTQVASAQAGYAQAQAQYGLETGPPVPAVLAAARAAVQEAQAQADLAQANLADATLAAPFAGRVSAVNLSPGEIAAAGAPVVTLVSNDAKALEIRAQVPETDITRLRVGETAWFTPDANGENLPGVVLAVAASAQNNMNVSTYQVTMSVPGAAGKLFPGMTGTATIATAQAKNVLHVPATAIHLQGKKTYVWLEQPGGKLIKRKITVGLYNAGDIQIRRGLRAGDKVLLGPKPQGG